MSRISGFNSVLIITLVVSAFQCFADARSDDNKQLLSADLLKKASLKIVWENELPFKNNEKVDEFFLLGDDFYCLSDKNYIIALNKDTGTLIFGRSYAPVGFPVIGLNIYGDELFSVIGNKVVEMKKNTGVELSGVRLNFGVSCAAERNDSYFYIGGVDRRVHILRANDKIELFKVAADNDSAITSIVAGKEYMIFGTEKGNVVAVAADKPVKLWQFDARDAVADKLVKDAGSLFVSSKDTNVYKIDIPTGRLLWKYQTQAMLDRAPRITDRVVYQYVWAEGITAIDRTDGKFLWQLPKAIEFLAENNGKAYLITEQQTLVVMDNKSGKKLYSLNLDGIDRYVSNTKDSKIYIGTKSGHILCLNPVE